jgi:hypothetical protein
VDGLTSAVELSQHSLVAHDLVRAVQLVLDSIKLGRRGGSGACSVATIQVPRVNTRAGSQQTPRRNRPGPQIDGRCISCAGAPARPPTRACRLRGASHQGSIVVGPHDAAAGHRDGLRHLLASGKVLEGEGVIVLRGRGDKKGRKGGQAGGWVGGRWAGAQRAGRANKRLPLPMRPQPCAFAAAPTPVAVPLVPRARGRELPTLTWIVNFSPPTVSSDHASSF